MRNLLFHVIEPENDAPGWKRFQQESAFFELPPDCDQLAPNVWIFSAYSPLSLLCHQLGLVCRYVEYSHAREWTILP